MIRRGNLIIVRGEEKELEGSKTVHPWNTMIVSDTGAVKFGDGRSTYGELPVSFGNDDPVDKIEGKE